MAIITISRDYGCGGEIVAELVAKELGYKLVSKEIIEYISILTDTPKKLVEKFDEERHSTLKATLSKYFSLDVFRDIFEKKEEEQERRVLSDDDVIFYDSGYQSDSGMDSEVFQNMAERIIKKLAYEDNVVILGRGSQVILQEYGNAVHLRLYADIEHRIKNVMERFSLNEHDAKKVIASVDKRKRKFLLHYYDRDIDDPTLYHFQVNLSKMELEKCAKMIIDYIKIAYY